MLLISIILNIINRSDTSGDSKYAPDIFREAYETTMTAEDEEVFTDPEKALEQMTEDSSHISDEWQHLIETLNNTYKEVNAE